MARRKSTRELILAHLDEHLIGTNTGIASYIGRTPADVSSTANRLYKAGVLVRLHAEFSATHLYALRENRHVAKLSIRLSDSEYRNRLPDF